MKSTISKIGVAGMVAAAVVGVASAEVSVTMDLASAYVYRGVTFLDGASFQPGIEVSGFGLNEAYGSVAAGIWGSMDLEGANSSTFQETDYYVSYSLPIEAIDISIGYCEYSYAAGSSDKEMSIGLGYDLAGLGLFATYYQGIGGGIGSSIYAEFGVGYDFEVTETLSMSAGARVGYADEDGGDSGFHDYDLSLGLGYALSEKWSLGASLVYIGQIDDAVLTDAEYDVDFVGIIGLSCEM
jgi:uncharacterized protein (TIGR02001 family)